MNRKQLCGAAVGALAALTLFAGAAGAASHSDAPLIKQDPHANLTDVYAFLGTRPGVGKVLNVVVHVRPLIDPGDGVLYDRFADDALYSIHVANPSTGATVLRYDFRFSSVNPAGPPRLKNPDTILSYGRGADINGAPDVGAINLPGDAHQNYTQLYSVTRIGGGRERIIGRDLLTPPPNVGARTTPFYNDKQGRAVSGATAFSGLDRYTRQTIFNLQPTGETVFAGMREDGFFGDVAGIFDLLDPRILGNSLGQAGSGPDFFKGYNVLAYAIQVPVANLPSLEYTLPDLLGGKQTGVGVYASVSRPLVTLRSNNGEPASFGPFVQVNRMGNPLFNELLVALRDKDRYNRTSPTADAAFATYARNPEVAVLINATFGTNFQTTGRDDLVAIFIPDVLRVNTTTDPVRLAGQPGFSRLGFIGGDTTNGLSSGWPNGRRFGDDVIDIALTAVASGPTFQTITVVGDNVNVNDQVYHQVFPYSATPHSGTNVSQDP